MCTSRDPPARGAPAPLSPLPLGARTVLALRARRSGRSKTPVTPAPGAGRRVPRRERAVEAETVLREACTR